MWMYLISTCSIIFLSNAQNQSRQCGLPENMSNFPDFAQEEIKAVWKNYVPGTKCDKELLVTDDIIAVLNMFETEVPGGLDGISTPQQLTATSTGFQTTPTATTTPVAATAVDQFEFLPISTTFFAPSTTPPVQRATNPSFSTSTEEQRLVDKENDYLDPEPNPKPLQKNFIPSQFPEDDYAEENFEKTPLDEMQSRFPFLDGASKKTVRAFFNVVNDPDVPSERRRQELIHVLAVSYLNEDQLEQFNAWSTSRRKKILAREQQLRHLSFRARDALRRLSALDEEEQKAKVQELPPSVKQELHAHAKRLLALRT